MAASGLLTSGTRHLAARRPLDCKCINAAGMPRPVEIVRGTQNESDCTLRSWYARGIRR